MRMQVTACLCVNQTNHVLISDEFNRCFRIIRLRVTIRIEEPIVICILMMIASDLLLLRPFRVGLNVRMKKTTTITHIFKSGSRTVSDFKRAIFSNLRTSKISLEQRAHLRIPGTAIFQDEEVYPEGEHVNDERKDNKAHNSRPKVFCELNLFLVSRHGDRVSWFDYLWHL